LLELFPVVEILCVLVAPSVNESRARIESSHPRERFRTCGAGPKAPVDDRVAHPISLTLPDKFAGFISRDVQHRDALLAIAEAEEFIQRLQRWNSLRASA